MLLVLILSFLVIFPVLVQVTVFGKKCSYFGKYLPFLIPENGSPNQRHSIERGLRHRYQGPEKLFGVVYASVKRKRRYWRQNWSSDANEAASFSELS